MVQPNFSHNPGYHKQNVLVLLLVVNWWTNLLCLLYLQKHYTTVISKGNSVKWTYPKLSPQIYKMKKEAKREGKLFLHNSSTRLDKRLMHMYSKCTGSPQSTRHSLLCKLDSFLLRYSHGKKTMGVCELCGSLCSCSAAVQVLPGMANSDTA